MSKRKLGDGRASFRLTQCAEVTSAAQNCADAINCILNAMWWDAPGRLASAEVRIEWALKNIRAARAELMEKKVRGK